jgi:hypothetical protein
LQQTLLYLRYEQAGGFNLSSDPYRFMK